MANLESFVSKVKETPIEQLEDGIQTAIVLTGDNNIHGNHRFSWFHVFLHHTYDCIIGVNVPDHETMFQKTISKLESITKHTAIIWSRDSDDIKSILEESVYQLISSEQVINYFMSNY